MSFAVLSTPFTRQITPGQDKELFDAAAATVQYKLDKGGKQP